MAVLLELLHVVSQFSSLPWMIPADVHGYGGSITHERMIRWLTNKNMGPGSKAPTKFHTNGLHGMFWKPCRSEHVGLQIGKRVIIVNLQNKLGTTLSMFRTSQKPRCRHKPLDLMRQVLAKAIGADGPILAGG